jgi:hypothetical protein
MDETKIYECSGCGRTTLDPEADLSALHAADFRSCCPERNMVHIFSIPQKLADQLYFSNLIHVDAELGWCWLWQGRINRNGYGRIRWRGKEPVAHRLIYELATALEIPPMHVLDHRCEVRNCCNPRHLDPVTTKVNTHRGKAVLFKAAYKYAKENGRL